MIADVPLQVLIDTGASINVNDETAYRTIIKLPQNKQMPLRHAATKIYSSGGSKPLPVLETFTSRAESKQTLTPATIYVIRCAHGCLLSYQTAKQLELISVNTSAIASVDSSPPTASNNSSNDLTTQYSDFFTALGS